MPDTTNTNAKGWVYLIVNDLIPTRVKVGYTMRFPIDRAQELVTTGTTGTFVVIYQALVHSPYRVEQEVHKRLASTNRGLEWFEVCPNRAKEEILCVAGGALYEDTKPCWPRSQPEPSERTKELLHEAKKAADELRRLNWEAEEAARVATEERLRREAAEAERLRQLKQLEDDRIRAEEAVRLTQQKEQERLEEEDRQRRLAEKKRRQAIQAQLLIRNTKLGLGVAALVLVACGLFHLAFGPFSPAQIESLREAAASLEEKAYPLQVRYTKAQQELQVTKKSLATLPITESLLKNQRAECERNEASDRTTLASVERILAEVIAEYAPYGRPTGPRGGVSLKGIQAELDLRERNAKSARAAYTASQAATSAVRSRIEAIPAAIAAAKKREQELAPRIAELNEQITIAERNLNRAQQELAAALQHNSGSSAGAATTATQPPATPQPSPTQPSPTQPSPTQPRPTQPRPTQKPKTKPAVELNDLAVVEALRRVRVQQLEEEIGVRLRSATTLMKTNPKAALQDLKDLQQAVFAIDDIDDDGRSRLLTQIDARIREAIMRLGK